MLIRQADCQRAKPVAPPLLFDFSGNIRMSEGKRTPKGIERSANAVNDIFPFSLGVVGLSAIPPTAYMQW